MPYEPEDVTRFTRKATTPKRKRQWVKVYDSMRSRGKSEGSAIRGANGVIRKRALSRAPARSRR